MRNASGARVSIRHARDLGVGAGIQQMKDGEGGAAVFIDTQEAVPEGVGGDGGDVESVGVNLAMEFVEAVDGQIGEFFGIDFDAAVGSAIGLVGEARAVAFDLAGFASNSSARTEELPMSRLTM